MSNQVTVRCFLSLLASCISWDNIAICSRHPKTPGIPSLCMLVLIYMFLRSNFVSLHDNVLKYNFPSTLSKDIVRNFCIFFALFSLGMKTPSALLQLLLTSFFLQIAFKYIHSNLATPGHFLYTL